ncbi:MAG: protein kinase, partial [Proteobacteria bacterium]|nr:protein kinase [Pseudomonadota bacterium]
MSGHYEIDGVLGRGRRAGVYSANRSTDGEQVALKWFNEDAGVDVQALRRGVAALASAGEWHVVPSGVEMLGGRPALTTPIITGLDMGGFPRGEAQPAKAVLQLIVQLARACDKLAHQNLKPSDVLVLPDGAVRILDAGLAAQATSSGGFVSLSSAGYTAPEQLHGGPSMATDVYAIGVIAYGLLVGRAFGSAAANPDRHASKIDRANGKLIAAAGHEVASLITEMIAYSPGDRLLPQGVASLADKLASTTPGADLAEWGKAMASGIEARREKAAERLDGLVGHIVDEDGDQGSLTEIAAAEKAAAQKAEDDAAAAAAAVQAAAEAKAAEEARRLQAEADAAAEQDVPADVSKPLDTPIGAAPEEEGTFGRGLLSRLAATPMPAARRDVSSSLLGEQPAVMGGSRADKAAAGTPQLSDALLSQMESAEEDQAAAEAAQLAEAAATAAAEAAEAKRIAEEAAAAEAARVAEEAAAAEAARIAAEEAAESARVAEEAAAAEAARVAEEAAAAEAARVAEEAAAAEAARIAAEEAAAAEAARVAEEAATADAARIAAEEAAAAEAARIAAEEAAAAEAARIAAEEAATAEAARIAEEAAAAEAARVAEEAAAAEARVAEEAAAAEAARVAEEAAAAEARVAEEAAAAEAA